MNDFVRFAIYYAPRPGVFADLAADWLGWDPVDGERRTQPRISSGEVALTDITTGAAKYGFHGTIRPPFRPDRTVGYPDIATVVSELAAELPKVRLGRLRIENLGGFLAFIPSNEPPEFETWATRIVDETNHLRAELTPAEIAKRRPDELSFRQRQLLERYGYPFVIEEFRFHLTVTDRLPAHLVEPVAAAIRAHFGDGMPVPFVIEDLCLFGEDDAGRFHLLDRYALTG